MNPEMPTWKSAKPGNSAMSECGGQGEGPTYALAVLKPRDLNGHYDRQYHAGRSRRGYVSTLNKSDKENTGVASTQNYLKGQGHEDYYVTVKGYCAPDDVQSRSSDVPHPSAYCASSSFKNQGPSYAGAVLNHGDHHRGQVSLPVRSKKRFQKFKTRRQQRKHNRPRKEEQSYAAILKRGGPPLALMKCGEPKTLEQLAEDFIFTDECTAMMLHLELNCERMPYTKMLK